MNDLPNPRPRRFGARFFMTVLLVLVAAAAGAVTMYFVQVRKPLEANVDENRRTASQFNIRSIPTMLIFKNGELVDQIVGAQPKQAIAARLTAQL